MCKKNIGLIFFLAVKDLIYDKKISLCIIASIASVITPLLLLFSLKYGIIEQLREQLLKNPKTLEIKILGNFNLAPEDISWIKGLDEVEYAIPLTRSLSTQVDASAGSKRFVKGVELLSTSEGDPLLKDKSENLLPQQAIVSSSVARELKLEVGSTFKLLVMRKYEEKTQNAQVSFTAKSILKESQTTDKVIFVSLEDLLEIESFYDGYEVPLFESFGGKEETLDRERSFAKARIYAKSLEDVAPLASKLRDKHIEIRTKADEIENVQAQNRAMIFIFIVIATTSLIGCILAFFGSFLSSIERKRKELAFMELMGFREASVLLFLLFQAFILTLFSFCISCILYYFGSIVFNAVLGANLGANYVVSQLKFYHYLIAFGGCVLITLFVVLLGSINARKIEAAESLREN